MQVDSHIADTHVSPSKHELPYVLIVCLSVRHGGVDLRVTQTAQELARLGLPYSVVVVKDSILHRELSGAGIICHPLRRKRSDPRILLDLIKLIRETGAGVIDAHNSQSQIWSALAALATGINGRVSTTHSVYRDDHPRRLKRFIHESSLRLCRVAGFSFIAVSRSVERYLTQAIGVSADRVILSRNGIAPLSEPVMSISLAAEAGWPADVVILSMIGRLDARKGHVLAIQAMYNLVQAGQARARLFIAGTGKEEKALKSLTSKLGLESYVSFAGFRKDVPSILAQTDLFLLPSFSEGLPYALLEAARQGVPTLSSRLEGTEDSFSNDETIFFVPPRDEGALTQRLRNLIDAPDRLREIGVAAQRMVEDRMQVQAMFSETLAAYRKAANQRR